eukprot:TRINITY_DN20210_c0_g1_i1.p1 TRINITY_DN20210_c0_g1~~TRINITY_DN20210_c0_g1_i1.p1  ORF type:complete len:307 (+),score=30.46 TRINITY_DN20210_c0_g1_i1:65-985(+)
MLSSRVVRPVLPFAGSRSPYRKARGGLLPSFVLPVRHHVCAASAARVVAAGVGLRSAFVAVIGHGRPRRSGGWTRCGYGGRRAATSAVDVGASTEASVESDGVDIVIDVQYPGTAVARLRNIHERIKSLEPESLNGDWEDVRRKLLWVGGLRDLPDAAPGQGYTGHAFNDDNHCDLCAMLGKTVHSLHDGTIGAIAKGNHLGSGIEIASLPELGPGGSWSTCTNGCDTEPPRDVAHIQFKARIAFKLVWCPPNYTKFVLVDDAGSLLATGEPTGQLPAEIMRVQNYMIVAGSKYARAADKISQQLN